MIKPPVIANVIHGSSNGIEAGDIIETSPERYRLGREFFIGGRFSHHEVYRSCRLGSVHKSRAPANKLHCLHRIGWRKVVRLRIPNHVRLNGNSVFQDLKTLQSVRIKSSIRHAGEWSRLLRDNQPGCRCRDLTPVIVFHLWQVVRINVRGSLSCIDPRSLHIGQEGQTSLNVIVRLNFHLLQAHNLITCPLAQRPLLNRVS